MFSGKYSCATTNQSIMQSDCREGVRKLKEVAEFQKPSIDC